MTPIQHTILVWLLACAGLFIIVLYSPIGSPDFYASPDDGTESRNFTPIYGTIANAPKTHTIFHNTQDESNMPELASSLPSNPGTGNTGTKSNYNNGSFNRSTLFPSYHHVNTASTGVSGSPLLAGGGTRNSAGSSEITMTNGITTLSITSGMDNNISKQNSTEQITSTDGNSDPGGPPEGNPIPAGDGWGLLVFFGIGYAIYKKLFKINQ